MNLIEEFNDYRSKMNERIMAEDNKVIKRFFNLDTNTYAEGELDIAMIIGGSIVIPHLRRAVEYWEELEKQAETDV